MNLYAIRDIKANAFAAPFLMQSDVVALRAASDLTNDKSTTVYRHPSDYEIWFLGVYDEETGAIESNPKHLAGCVGFAPKE